MVKKLKNMIHIYLIDDQQIYFNEINERFLNPQKYEVYTFTSTNSFIKHFKSELIPQYILQIVFLSIDPDQKNDENKSAGIETIKEIKKISPVSEVYALSSKISEDFENMVITAGAVGLIQKNENAVLRMTNHIKGMISEKILERKHRTSWISISVLFCFILAVIIITAIIYFINRDYFLF
jgi:DNA-binding NarL/FixJ family response regulator